MNHASRGADVALEVVVREDYGASVAFYHERRHVLNVVDDESIVELPIWVDDLLEEVPGRPDLVHALLQLDVGLRGVRVLNDHLFVVEVVERVGRERLMHQDLLNVGHVVSERGVGHLDGARVTLHVHDHALVLEFSEIYIAHKVILRVLAVDIGIEIQSMDNCVECIVVERGVEDADEVVRVVLIVHFLGPLEIRREVQQPRCVRVGNRLKLVVIDDAFGE